MHHPSIPSPLSTILSSVSLSISSCLTSAIPLHFPLHQFLYPSLHMFILISPSILPSTNPSLHSFLHLLPTPHLCSSLLLSMRPCLPLSLYSLLPPSPSFPVFFIIPRVHHSNLPPSYLSYLPPTHRIFSSLSSHDSQVFSQLSFFSPFSSYSPNVTYDYGQHGVLPQLII